VQIIQLFRRSANSQRKKAYLRNERTDAGSTYHRSILLEISTCAGQTCQKYARGIFTYFCSTNQLSREAPVRPWQLITTRIAFRFSPRETNLQMLAMRLLVLRHLCSYLYRRSPRRSRDHSRMAQIALETTRRRRFLFEISLAECPGHFESCSLAYSWCLFS
jgi:hypothetical protein